MLKRKASYMKYVVVDVLHVLKKNSQRIDIFLERQYIFSSDLGFFKVQYYLLIKTYNMYNNGNILFIYNWIHTSICTRARHRKFRLFDHKQITFFWEKKSNQRQSTFITFTFAELTARHLSIFSILYLLCKYEKSMCVFFCLIDFTVRKKSFPHEFAYIILVFIS